MTHYSLQAKIYYNTNNRDDVPFIAEPVTQLHKMIILHNYYNEIVWLEFQNSSLLLFRLMHLVESDGAWCI